MTPDELVKEWATRYATGRNPAIKRDNIREIWITVREHEPGFGYSDYTWEPSIEGGLEVNVSFINPIQEGVKGYGFPLYSRTLDRATYLLDLDELPRILKEVAAIALEGA